MTELARRRNAMKMSQRDCAGRVGVKQATLQAWEAGASIPNTLSAERYAEVLGVTVAELNDLLRDGQAKRMRDEHPAPVGD